MTRHRLDPALGFAALAARLRALGWHEERLPALLPPLIPGEPELARFRRGDAVLDYGFDPVRGLRWLEGAEDPFGPAEDALVAVLRGGVEEASRAAIVVARKGLCALAPLVEAMARPSAAAYERPELELFTAVRRVVLACLRGQAEETEAQARFRRCLLGQDTDPDMMLRLAPLLPAGAEGGMAWIGLPPPLPRACLPNPPRRVARPEGLRFGPLAGAPLPAEALGLRGRLATAEELEAALRGTDGRPFPGGLSPRAPPPAGWPEPVPPEGEWVMKEGALAVALPGRIGRFRRPLEGARHAVRPVQDETAG